MIGLLEIEQPFYKVKYELESRKKWHEMKPHQIQPLLRPKKEQEGKIHQQLMKWGRKKVSSTSSHPSLITHVFPISWFSKFKHKDSCESKSAKKGEQLDLPSPSSSSLGRWKEGRFYSGDNDAYWRLSFGEEAEKSTVGLNSVLYHSDDDELGIPISHSKGFKPEDVEIARREVTWKFSDMVSDIRKPRNLDEKVGVRTENDAFRRKKSNEEAELKTPQRNPAKHHKLRKLGRKNLEERKAEKGSNKEEELASKSSMKVIFEEQPGRIIHTGDDFWGSRVSNLRKQQRSSFSNRNLGTIEEDCTLEASNFEESTAFSEKEDEEMSLQWKILKAIKTKEMKPKSEQQRRSVYIYRDYQSKRRKSTSRIKSHSPRTISKIECKIKALEDIKKAKRMKKKTKERAAGDATAFDSYALVKSSFNPQQDFRDSMIEMIIEKRIERPEELEELLACYLTLNYDEYHDLIVKVFRQVWYELIELYLATKLQNDHRSNDYQPFA
ncbi:hypothetical protein ACH5RR_018301 [Cinchona calisaya]|uniref:Transcription repressor n=1 Tax=Cinchona calisaya TaxID=153742 RepID=A0ABD2ZL29_9GENT